MSLRILRCSLFLFLLITPIAAMAADIDKDGLSDSVEAALGSSDFHKDIFVEIDWLVVNGKSFKPRAGFDSIVTAIFAAAPVNNPDGTTGIRIHISYSNAIVANVPVLGYKKPNGTYVWDDFDVVKSLYFTPSRWSTHHYCLFVKDYGDEFGQATGSSGISRNGSRFTAGASDFLVALGGKGWYNYPNKKNYKWTQAGTFVHELGHNLGLKHGGNDHTNYKPNLLSLMNYSFQTDGIPYTANNGSRYLIFDYSSTLLPALPESNLNEGNGLGPKASDPYGVYGTTWYSWNGNDYDTLTTFNATGSVDWNNNGFLNSGVYEDVNQDGKYKILRGKNQWAKLVFTGGFVGAGVSATALPRETSYDCLTFKEHQLHNKKVDVDTPRVTMKELREQLKKQ